MEWVVTTAKTVAEAKDAALDELGVDESDAEFEILEEPRQGLFGRQRGEARVRARVRPTSPRPKVERRSRTKKKAAEETPEDSNTRSKSGTSGRRSSGGAGEGATGGLRAAASTGAAAEDSNATTVVSGDAPVGRTGRSRTASAPAPVDSAGLAGSAGDGAPRSPRRRPAKALAPDVAEAVAAAAQEAIEDAPEPKRRRGAGTGRGASARTAANGRNGDPAGRSPASAGTDKGAHVPEEELSIEEQGQIAERFVVGLLERFKAPAQTSVRPVDDDTVEIEVQGTELGLLIGPKGQTLQAVQELTRTVVQRKSVARTGRIHVDIAGYRSKRREALERFTTQVANDVVATGVQRVLEPMSAADRKVVHDTANTIGGVRTVSEGEDPRRRVVIIPDGSGAAAGAQPALAADES
ncbi:MAG: hypothetical protein NVSMB12_10480 [Acidimicrobiales bacterium]